MNQPLTVTLTQKAPLTSLLLGMVTLIALIVLPFLALLPADHPLAISTYTLTLIGKILCYAVVAIALDLVWDMPDCYHLGTDYFLLWAVMPWGCI